jgi:hypothetical protein
LVLGLSLLGLGCADVEQIERGACGNGVIEKGEDCEERRRQGNISPARLRAVRVGPPHERGCARHRRLAARLASSAGAFAARGIPTSARSAGSLRAQLERLAPGNTRIKADEWHHVAAAYSTTAGKLTEYVDGLPVQSFDLAGTTAATPVAAYIGCRKDAASPAQFFIGALDELVPHQRALSAAEISDYVRRTTPTP